MILHSSLVNRQNQPIGLAFACPEKSSTNGSQNEFVQPGWFGSMQGFGPVSSLQSHIPMEFPRCVLFLAFARIVRLSCITTAP